MTRRGVTATDRLVVGYVALNSAIVVLRAGELPAWPWLLAVNLLIVGLVALLARSPDSATTAFLGGGYPLLLTGALYTQLGILGIAHAHFHDLSVQRWEMAVFGTQVSITWHTEWPRVAFSWIMHGAYWAYFVMIPGVMLVLWWRSGRDAYARAGFIIALGFYACYLIESLFPVMGPRHYFGDATGPIAEILPARLMRGTQREFTAMGTAFPSSHVAACWCAVYALWRDLPRLALWTMPIAAALALGTVYGQFHYGVDALSGALLAVALCAVADRLRSAWEPGYYRSS